MEVLTEQIQVTSYFQPIVDLVGCDIYGYEMLARDSQGKFTPLEMFEQAKLYNYEWEFEKECRIAAINRIKSLSTHYSDKFFFLNVSPYIFNSSEFMSGFTVNYIKECGINHRKIVLEITETASIENYENFEKLVGHYVEQGFKIAIDDFGAGHSGLTTLVAMAPHIMKIDMEIIRDIDKKPYKQKLLKTLCNFASDVGSHILAEGIETYEELETVFRMGVRYVQGYFLGRPSINAEVLSNEQLRMIKNLTSRYKLSSISTSKFLKDIIIKPDVFNVGELTCWELDSFFKRNQLVDHVVLTENSYPLLLITRQMFYKMMSGRFGFSLRYNHRVEDVFNRDYLVFKQSVDLLTIKKIALNRCGSDAFDPVIIVDETGLFVGTITMKMLIERAIDLEIFNATDQNPLTQLPGNGSIKNYLNQLSCDKPFTVIYIDIDHFKEFNDSYGFSCGDDMILMLANILKEQKMVQRDNMFLGHIGGDDFIIIADKIIGDTVLEKICREFDQKKIELFNEDDINNNSYTSRDRKGNEVNCPLTTISVAAFTNNNFKNSFSSTELALYAAKLKTRTKELTFSSSRSEYLIERRVY